MGHNHDHQHLRSIKFEANTKNSKSGDYGLIKAPVPEQAGASLPCLRHPPQQVLPHTNYINSH